MNENQNPIKDSNLNLDSQTVNAAKNGDKKALLESLSAEDRQKLDSVLNDKEKLESILKSPIAAAILKALGGKNG